MSRITPGTMSARAPRGGRVLFPGLLLLLMAPIRALADPTSDPGGPDTLSSVTSEATDVERPVPFDSAGRVVTITPEFARRFALGAPWSVTGEYVGARLYERSRGGFVLVVERAGGALERTMLPPAEREALARLIGESIHRAGGVTTSGERADVISEPAGGAFTRNQTVAAALVWGPALGAMTDDASAGSAVYLATVGTTFFVATSMARRGNITRAQDYLASDGAYRGAAIGAALSYAVGGDDVSSRAEAAAVLGGSLATTALGFAAGRSMTDGEANGATWGSTFSALVAAGAIGVAGGWGDSNQGEVGGVVAAGIAGYPLGLRWVRHSNYGITAGDVTAIRAASFIGTAAGAAFLDDEADDRVIAGVLTGGFVAGSFVGARAFARPCNLTGSQGLQLTLGALAGGLMAIVPPVLAESDNRQVYLGAAAAGAAAGMGITGSLLGLDRASDGRRADGAGTLEVGPSRQAGLRFMPQNLAFVLARQPGRIPLARLEF